MKKGFTVLCMLLSSYAFAECPKGTYSAQELAKQHQVDMVKELAGKPTCALVGTYTDDLFLSNNNSYVLVGGVFIGADNGKGGSDMQLDPAQLTIAPGTQIFGLNPQKDLRLPENQRVDRKDFLVIGRGSKIMAEGTKDAPIIFTSAQGMHLPESQRTNFARQRGDWGGLFLNGMAPMNKCPKMDECVAQGEAGTGYYGGNRPSDNSGVLRYVRVEFGGDKINDDKEFNGVTFNGVGSGTLVEYVQVHKNNDDGIEFFGGTVNGKYILVSGAGDDSIDWTYGYTGMLQFVAVIQDNDDGDFGIEADNDKNVDLQPRSNPTLSNITLVGGYAGKSAILLRVGSAATIANSVITSFPGKCLDTTTAHLPLVKIYNNVFSCAEAGDLDKFSNNQMVSASLLKLRGFRPTEESIVYQTAGVYDDLDLFFEAVDFVGAVGADDWTLGWTTNAAQ